MHLLPAIETALARPSILLTLLSLAGLVLLFAGRRGARWLLLAGIGSQAALAVLPLDRWAARPLEQRYPRLADPPAHVDGIVVLGGAHRLAVSRDRHTPGLNSEGERMTEFLALARRYPEARLVYAGGAADGGWSERDAASLLFGQFGVLPRVAFEDRSQNTWENAVFARRLADPRAGQTWLLVTSAVHMPRAMGAFRAAGWPAMLADPVAYRTPVTGDWLGAVSDRLAYLDVGMHEWVGLLTYRLRGRAR